MEVLAIDGGELRNKTIRTRHGCLLADFQEQCRSGSDPEKSKRARYQAVCRPIADAVTPPAKLSGSAGVGEIVTSSADATVGMSSPMLLLHRCSLTVD